MRSGTSLNGVLWMMQTRLTIAKLPVLHRVLCLHFATGSSTSLFSYSIYPSSRKPSNTSFLLSSKPSATAKLKHCSSLSRLVLHFPRFTCRNLHIVPYRRPFPPNHHPDASRLHREHYRNHNNSNGPPLLRHVPHGHGRRLCLPNHPVLDRQLLSSLAR